MTVIFHTFVTMIDLEESFLEQAITAFFHYHSNSTFALDMGTCIIIEIRTFTGSYKSAFGQFQSHGSIRICYAIQVSLWSIQIKYYIFLLGVGNIRGYFIRLK